MSDRPVFVHGWMPRWLLEALRTFCWVALNSLAQVEIRHAERLSASGGYVVAINHMTYFEAPLLFTQFKGRRPTVFAASKYRNHPFRVFLEAVDCIWVDRGHTSAATVKAAIRALRGGGVLGLAPEGTRSRTAQLLPGKTGPIFLAISAGVPIFPAAVSGVEQILPSLKRLRRARVTLVIGRPLVIPAGARPTPEQLETLTAELMYRIAAMLPEQYHGAYAGHPRVRELQEADSAIQ